MDDEATRDAGEVGPPVRRGPRPFTIATLAATLLLIAVAVVAAFAASGRLALPGRCTADDAACLRVLFVGNSYTYVNDLPGTVADLVRAGGTPMEVATVAVGGATLADHATSTETGTALGAQRWTDVVFQEQSLLPASPGYRAAEFIPAARVLAGRIAPSGARTLLFETWAHRDGWPEEGIDGYGPMQDAIDQAYAEAGRATGATVVPVGAAWRAALAADPALELWQADGSHPAPAGTYLAACVFYAALTSRSPVGLPARLGVSDDVARELQRVAETAVLGSSAPPSGSAVP